MLLQNAAADDPAAQRRRATAFRDDGSATLVSIIDLSFDRCQLSSIACFDVGERLRIHLPGQGFIVVTVTDAERGKASAVFKNDCPV